VQLLPLLEAVRDHPLPRTQRQDERRIKNEEFPESQERAVSHVAIDRWASWCEGCGTILNKAEKVAQRRCTFIAFQVITRASPRGSSPLPGQSRSAQLTLSMFAEPARQLIPRRLVDRLAPRVYAVDVWDGVGDSRPCDGCGQAVTKRERAGEAIVSMWLSVYFHAECYDFWKSERLAVSDKESQARAG
jgi:hypothetical protein